MRYFVFISLILVVSTAFYVTTATFNGNENQRLNNTILIATLFAIIWYTVETNLMQKTIKRQTDISVMPRLAGHFKDNNKLTLVNVGNGVAINISIDPVFLDEKWDLRLVMGKVLYLYPQQEREIAISAYCEDKKLNSEFDANLNEKYATRTYEVRVLFEDISGVKHSQILVLGKKGPIIGSLLKKEE